MLEPLAHPVLGGDEHSTLPVQETAAAEQADQPELSQKGLVVEHIPELFAQREKGDPYRRVDRLPERADKPQAGWRCFANRRRCQNAVAGQTWVPGVPRPCADCTCLSDVSWRHYAGQSTRVLSGCLLAGSERWDLDCDQT